MNGSAAHHNTSAAERKRVREIVRVAVAELRQHGITWAQVVDHDGDHDLLETVEGMVTEEVKA